MQIEAITKARDWTAGMAAYDLVLAKMKSVGAATLPAEPSTKPNRKKRKQPEAPSDLPLPDTGTNSASAEPSGTSQSKKGKRKQKDKPLSSAADANSLPSAASLSMASPIATAAVNSAAPPVTVMLDLPEAKPQAVRARGRHIGRYHKTTAAKKAGAYSRSDLAAILGVDSLPAAAMAPITVAAITTPASSDEQVSCPLGMVL